MQIRRSNKSGLTAVSLLFVLILIGGLAATWFKVLGPFLLNQKIGLANHNLEFNKFDEAGDQYEMLLAKAGPEHKQMLKDRVAQVPLMKKYVGKLPSNNPNYVFGVLDALTAKLGLVYIRFRIENRSNKPLPIRSSLFYLKSNVGKSEVALNRPQNIEVDVADVTLKPGEGAEGGICVKYIMSGGDKLELIYNNGTLYLRGRVSQSRIWAMTDKNEFDKKPGWKGRTYTIKDFNKKSAKKKMKKQKSLKLKK